MPPVSEKQRRAMWAAAEGHSTLGIPEKVGKEFVEADSAEPSSELDMAKAMREGRLESPQKYENVHLFDVRITGTGTSYRQALDEYVYRPPEDFLSDDFVARCNGLPVVFEHPEGGILDTEEYRNRAIGTIVLPYVKGDEVWGIAKIFDDDAAKLMRTSHASTSPAVVFRDAGSTESVALDDGSSLLIEGKPSYLDHLAICGEGVWDKGGSPSGVNNSNEETQMADDSKAPAWADALSERLDAMCSRLDALEGGKHEEHDRKDESEHEGKVDAKRHDGEEAVKEKRFDKRRDSEEESREAGEREEEHEEQAVRALEKAKKEGEEEKRESERADAQARSDATAAKIAALEAKLSRLTALPSNEDRDAIAKAHMRADALARMLADEVTHATPGESPIAYRKRLAAKFQKFSPSLKGVKLDSIDGPAFDLLEDRIYADAQAAAMSPEVTSSGRLIPQVRTDESGRRITSWHGDIKSWMAQFEGPPIAFSVNRFSSRQEHA